MMFRTILPERRRAGDKLLCVQSMNEWARGEESSRGTIIILKIGLLERDLPLLRAMCGSA